MKPPKNTLIASGHEPAEGNIDAEPVAASASGTKRTGCILIADSDESFRGLVASMLIANGYEIAESSTTDGATQVMLQYKPAAAIVDCKLAGGGGAAWIEQIRQDGCQMPVAFVSESWCDEQTFTWLRDTLKVSLILQKPIVPELFMHTIECVLPKTPGQKGASAIATDWLDEQIQSEYTQLLQSEDPQRILEQIEDMTATLQMGLDTAARVQALKEAVENKMLFDEAQEVYLAELPYIWRDLRICLERTRVTGSGVVLQEAKLKAHRIKGSSGTCGLPQIGALVEEVEAILCNLDDIAQGTIDSSGQRPNGRASWSSISRLVDQGTRLIDDLVRMQQQKRDGVEVVTANTAAAQSNGLRVLCVDDDRSLTRFLESVLRKRGYSTRSIAEPIGIVEVLNEFRPDLILLDAVMPGISGYEVCRLLKGHDDFKRIPVIFMTANSCSRRAAALRAGAEEFLSKPLLTDKLLSLVEQLLPAAKSD